MQCHHSRTDRVEKTTYSNFCTHLFNRDKSLEPPSRLDATTAAAVNRLYERDNCLTLIDDLISDAEKKTLHDGEFAGTALSRVECED